MICDTLEHLTLYQGFHKNLDTAITFLMACDLNTLPLGRTEVDGDTVFINVMDAELHPNEGSHPEYHRIYADLQRGLGLRDRTRHRSEALCPGHRLSG